MMYLAATVFPAPLSPLPQPRKKRQTTHRKAIFYCQTYLHGTAWASAWEAENSPDDNTLILPVNHHVSVHVVSQGVDVRWILILGL